MSIFTQRVGVLNPIALLQIAVSAQELHITDCTCATLTVRNDVVELQVGTWATNTAFDTSSFSEHYFRHLSLPRNGTQRTFCFLG